MEIVEAKMVPGKRYCMRCGMEPGEEGGCAAWGKSWPRHKYFVYSEFDEVGFRMELDKLLSHVRVPQSYGPQFGISMDDWLKNDDDLKVEALKDKIVELVRPMVESRNGSNSS